MFIAYNTAGAGGTLLHTICIVRKYFHFGPMVAALHSVFLVAIWIIFQPMDMRGTMMSCPLLWQARQFVPAYYLRLFRKKHQGRSLRGSMPGGCPHALFTNPRLLPVSRQNLNHEENRLLYGALVQIPNSGSWKLRINIQRDNETESIGTLLEVNPPASPPLAYWHLFILSPLGVLGFLLNQKARLRPQNKAKRV